jgi:hypothetical protein
MATTHVVLKAIQLGDQPPIRPGSKVDATNWRNQAILEGGPDPFIRRIQTHESEPEAGQKKAPTQRRKYKPRKKRVGEHGGSKLDDSPPA